MRILLLLCMRLASAKTPLGCSRCCPHVVRVSCRRETVRIETHWLLLFLLYGVIRFTYLRGAQMIFFFCVTFFCVVWSTTTIYSIRITITLPDICHRFIFIRSIYCNRKSQDRNRLQSRMVFLSYRNIKFVML